jgi:hypothetical protein
MEEALMSLVEALFKENCKAAFLARDFISGLFSQVNF